MTDWASILWPSQKQIIKREQEMRGWETLSDPDYEHRTYAEEKSVIQEQVELLNTLKGEHIRISGRRFICDKTLPVPGCLRLSREQEKLAMPYLRWEEGVMAEDVGKIQWVLPNSGGIRRLKP